ncbi:MAG TPA: hypothetical protein VFY93_08710 [Planctomycetota bacterium]|nr:hypothetical protein [Planctomycetota bacterium]
MRAAALLRLRELRRRGGLLLLAVACVAVFLVGLGSYGLASDLAATVGYAAAVLVGAFPLAIDRERRRSHLALASPVSPWAWALGSALGVGAGAGLAMFLLFAAAACGGAAAGGVPTHEAYPLNASTTIWILPERRITLPPDARAFRTEVRAYVAGEAQADPPSTVPLLVDGAERYVATDQPVVLPAAPPSILLGNPGTTFLLGIAGNRTAALGAERSFLGNALLAGVGPALAAMGIAALGIAAGAGLSAPVAALLVATLLLAASLRGFLLEAWEHEGKVAAAVTEEEREDPEGHGHRHRTIAEVPSGVRTAMRAVLGILPDLPAFDASDRVARGEWAGSRLKRFLGAAQLLGMGLLLAAALGGLGVRKRRAP